MPPKPPKWALRFFRWYCKPELLPYLEGDLLEHFHDKTASLGSQKARRKFITDVIKLFRPGIIRTYQSSQQLNIYTMFLHTLTISLRNFKRYTTTFFINLLGLSSGLIAVLLIYLWVSDELARDKFHENGNRVHQVLLNFDNPDNFSTINWTPANLGPTAVETLPEVSHYARLLAFDQKGTLSFEEGPTFRANEIYTDPAFFDMFSFPLITGSKSDVMSNQQSVVLSEKLALALFENVNEAVGKTLRLDAEELTGSYVVSGVFQNPPENSSLQFDAVFSVELLLAQNEQYTLWEYNDPDTYLMLEKGADPDLVRTKIEAFYLEKPNVSAAGIVMPRFEDKYLYGNYENGVQSGGRISYVRLFSGIALIILLIACINFMNLSTAQASRRLKEVGVKKALGIARRGLIFQFLTESLLLTFIAMALSLGLVALLLPAFGQLVGKSLTLVFEADLILALSGTLLLTGMVAGSYPALYLSGFRVVQLLKGKTKARTNDIWVRKGLVIFQFATSIVLVVAIVVVTKQVDLIQNKNLGYDRENVITFPAEGEISNKLRPFLADLTNIAGVSYASTTSMDLFENFTGTGGVTWDGKDPDAFIPFKYINANYDFIEVLDIKMVAGRSYSRDFPNDRDKIIINQTAANVMELDQPVGSIINIWNKNVEIIGVVEDFHFESLYQPIKPMFYRLNGGGADIMVRLAAGDQGEVIERVSDYYQEFNNGLKPEFKFLDTRYQQVYESESRVSGLARYFAAIAMIISCLGLFGLATFTVERKEKEIGVRKVLGAGLAGIMGLLTREFVQMVLIAIVLAIPVGYWITTDWLSQFAYHVSLHWWFFALSGVATLLVAMLTIGLRTYRAANINPVDCLKQE